ncbi:hypothetical protein CTI12_AA134390 [Artemisia annua]|uniref:Uncharacterized protein n=1 Tax=Artemisia annua TaxID=35608 RepID=A0A2U1PN26_ARTAN|nr:hypothetical protein CTI12_AA134390 [Artemisia annua]
MGQRVKTPGKVKPWDVADSVNMADVRCSLCKQHVVRMLDKLKLSKKIFEEHQALYERLSHGKGREHL